MNSFDVFVIKGFTVDNLVCGKGSTKSYQKYTESAVLFLVCHKNYLLAIFST